MDQVSAIVVTFNRKELLLRCIKALLKQTQKINTILIVDNNSTDGTELFLYDHGLISNDKEKHIEQEYEVIHSNINSASLINLDINSFEDYLFQFIYIKNNSNLGGAGGFYNGLNYAFNQRSDWYWLMDDDGYPEFDSLEKLFRKRSETQFLNPLVLNEKNHSNLSFGLYNYNLNVSITTRKDAILSSSNDLLFNTVNPFNGTLLSNYLVSKIKFPKKELFIWGDEVEYMYRASLSNFQYATVVNSVFYHPESRVGQVKLFNRYILNYQSNDLKNYCDFRNRSYIYWNYNKMKFFKNIILYSLYHILNLKISAYIFYLRATFDGLFQFWGKEKKFLITKNSNPN
jgi:rhamnopyranosyl-N-acetylglucosaminyl-diphospho-decaprenol beta-1,3/1,4-galactofuranosyltransferase